MTSPASAGKDGSFLAAWGSSALSLAREVKAVYRLFALTLYYCVRGARSI